MGVNEQALQLHTVDKKLYFLLQVTWKSISALQLMQEFVSGATSRALCLNM